MYFDLCISIFHFSIIKIEMYINVTKAKILVFSECSDY